MKKAVNLLESMNSTRPKLKYLSELPDNKKLLEGKPLGLKSSFATWKDNGFTGSFIQNKYSELNISLNQLAENLGRSRKSLQEYANKQISHLYITLDFFIEYNSVYRLRLIQEKAAEEQYQELFKELINGCCALIYAFRINTLCKLERTPHGLPQEIKDIYNFLGYDDFINSEVGNKQKVLIMVSEINFALVQSGFLIPDYTAEVTATEQPTSSSSSVKRFKS